MTITQLREFPTSLDRYEINAALEGDECFGTFRWKSDAPKGWHESLLRSFQVLQKVKHLLSINTPAEVILEIIAESGE